MSPLKRFLVISFWLVHSNFILAMNQPYRKWNPFNKEDDVRSLDFINQFNFSMEEENNFSQQIDQQKEHFSDQISVQIVKNDEHAPIEEYNDPYYLIEKTADQISIQEEKNDGHSQIEKYNHQDYPIEKTTNQTSVQSVKNDGTNQRKEDSDLNYLMAEDEPELLQWIIEAQKEQNLTDGIDALKNELRQQKKNRLTIGVIFQKFKDDERINDLLFSLAPYIDPKSELAYKWKYIYISYLFKPIYNLRKKETPRDVFREIAMLHYCLDEKITAKKIYDSINENSDGLTSINNIRNFISSKKYTNEQINKTVNNLLTELRREYSINNE
jgi:hypothetical protein